MHATAPATLPDAPGGLVARVSPRGRVVVEPSDAGALPPAVAGELVAAFAQGSGHGVLHLGAATFGVPLDPTLAFWARLGRPFVQAVCGSIDPHDPSAVVLPPADRALLGELVATVPPMPGAELVTVELLERVWGELGEALALRASEHAEGVQGYLAACHSVWHVAGRVCLHLAENRGDPAYPFAFVATYARLVEGRTRPQHVPLGRALTEYADARDKQKLVALLSPLRRAAAESALMRDLVDSGDIYHPLAWTAEDAHAFLREVEAFERAGLVARLPNWWRASRRRRPMATVTVGAGAPSAFGLDALLDFRVELTLDGETLSPDEIDQILQASAGLVLLRGQWVEVDPDKLQQVLDHWRAVAAQAAAGVSFGEAMRMLAGADLGPSAAGDEDEARPGWSQVTAGPWLAERLAALRAPGSVDDLEERAALQATLRPYQKQGVQWLRTLHALGLGACLADDMGLGKTIQVIALLSWLRRDGAAQGVDLLVVPASLLDNWRRELERFAPHLRVLVAHPSAIPSRRLSALPAGDVDAHDVVITSYGTAARTTWMRERAWGCLVLDEAQAIKNPGAKQTRAIKKLTAGWRLALTGTPVENRLGDLWSLFDFLNPGLLGTASGFGALCRRMGSGAARGGFAPLRRLVGPYILRRLKTDPRVISDLPDKTELTARCLLSKPQAALYQASVAELQRALTEAEGIERRGLVLAFLLRFKQICNHPSQWLGDEDFDPAHSGKFQRLVELCEPIAARQEKVLVFTQFRAMCEPLRQVLEACFGRPGLVLHGGTPVKRRAELVEAFQEDERVPFMVLSVKAGGTGLNLTAANHVIHFDRWWNPAVENQATDRAFRIGQRRNVLVHKFVCQGTVEERIDRLIADKQRLADEVLTGGAEVRLTELSDDELLAMVALDLHAAVSA